MEKIKRDLWNDDEWVISLGYYFFNRDTSLKSSNLVEFTNRLNNYTGKKRTAASIELRLCNYRSLDPEFAGSGMANDGRALNDYWKKYIVNDTSQKSLAERYSAFINAGSVTATENSRNDTSVDGQKDKKPVKSTVSSVITFYRSPVVKQQTLDRANGRCELCSELAPFITVDDTYFLEVHHITSLAHGGEDDCSNTMALCPNCHRKVHYSKQLTTKEKK